MKASALPEVRWTVRSGALDVSRPVVMGILNVTPDSFSDGGRHLDPERAAEHAMRMVREGADIIDVGGESTRPGAHPVDPGDERARIVPVLHALRDLPVPVSIDTRRASVAEAALDVGASIVNDISALGDPRMGELVASTGAGVILMHMRGTPATMQDDPRYVDVVTEVIAELSARVEAARAAGIPGERIVVDPGIGFGKTYQHNVELIRSLDRLTSIGRPILLGISRKAFLGQLLGGASVDQRVTATVAGCIAGLFAGARIFRVHDVAVVREALDTAYALLPAASAP